MNLFYFVEHQQAFPGQVFLPQLLHLPLSSRHSVNTLLHTPVNHNTNEIRRGFLYQLYTLLSWCCNVLQYDRKDLFLKSKLSLIIQLCFKQCNYTFSLRNYPCVGVWLSKNTSSSPLLSISWTHWTIREGIRGRVEGAKLSKVFYKRETNHFWTWHLHIRMCTMKGEYLSGLGWTVSIRTASLHT